MDLSTYLKWDATEMAKKVREKQISPAELVALSLAQLEKVNPSLNGTTAIRREQVLEEARKGLYAKGSFAGVPTFLKDTQAVAGEKLTSGSKILQENTSPIDSHLVRKFRESGLLFMGHTNTPEFALKNITEPVHYGATRNPWNPDYSPGGSSGGSAAMVASGVVPLAGASDGGGSIRIPASFTGLFGLKPTRGRTPVGPGVGRQWQGAAIDFILSRSVRDSATMLDSLQVNQLEAAFQTPLFPGQYNHAMKQPFEKPLRIAYTIQSPVDTPVSEDAKQAVQHTVNWLEKAGHHVEEKDNGVDGIELMKNYYVMNSGEISSLIIQLEQSMKRKITEKDVEIETWLLHEAGRSVSAAAFTSSLAARDNAAAKMVEFHETYDFYITPTTAYTAPKIGELTHSDIAQEQLCSKMKEASKEGQQQLIYDLFLPSLTYTPFTQLANLTGQPAISIPVHLSEQGLPLGVQIMALKGEEHRLLQIAYQMEQTELWIGMNGNPYM